MYLVLCRLLKEMWCWRNSAILGCTDKKVRLEVTEHLYSGVVCLTAYQTGCG